MPPVFVIVLIVLVGLTLYAFVGKARAEKEAKKAYFAVGVATQGLREIRRNNVALGSGDVYVIDQTLTEIEAAASLTKGN